MPFGLEVTNSCLRTDLRSGRDCLKDARSIFPNLGILQGSAQSRLEDSTESSLYMPTLKRCGPICLSWKDWQMIGTEGVSTIVNIHNASPESQVNNEIDSVNRRRIVLSRRPAKRTFEWHLKRLPKCLANPHLGRLQTGLQDIDWICGQGICQPTLSQLKMHPCFHIDFSDVRMIWRGAFD